MGTSVTIETEPLDIFKALHGLFNEVVSGTAHLNAAKSLAGAAKSHPVIMTASPSFFRFTILAHLEAAQLAAARLFDEHKDCVGIPWLITQTVNGRKEFSHRTDADLDDSIREAQQTRAAMAPVLSALKHRRDRWLAHLDRRTIKDPEQFEKDVKLTYPELEGLFASANHILSRMADLHGQAGYLIFGDDYDDLSHTLDLIEKGAQANAQQSG